MIVSGAYLLKSLNVTSFKTYYDWYIKYIRKIIYKIYDFLLKLYKYLY